MFLRLCAAAAFFLAIPAAFAAADAAPAAKPVIAVFNLAGDVTEQPAEDGLAALAGEQGPWLRDVVTRMTKAAGDPDVKAIVLQTDGAAFGQAQATELRQAIDNVRASGKEVYAHCDSISMTQYVLVSEASRLSVSPTGDIWVLGIYGDAPYLNGLLQKIGVQPEFLHCGAYKSAAEIFTRTGPSPEAEQMENWLLDSIYDTSIKLIAAGRHVSGDQVHGWIDQGPYTAEKAKANGMIDAVEDRQGLENFIKEKYGKDVAFDKRYGAPRQPQMDFSNPFALMSVFGDMMKKDVNADKPAVGVVYVDGMIFLGKKDPSPFSAVQGATSTDVASALDQAADDDSVKAVVLRIDSPGGSAVASEIILKATQRVKAKKPLVVSMGNVAGSGGYYVACAADTIFADDATITGSIGVVGGKLVTTEMWNKIGVTFKAYQRGANAGLISSDAVFSPAERQRMQTWMDEVYGVFKGHVTAIRGGRLKKSIDELAGGRVYTGRQALDLGLVDRIGTLQDAIAFTADQARIKDYQVRTVPEPKNILQRLIEQASGDENDRAHISADAGSSETIGPDSLMKVAGPYLSAVDPGHAKMIETALRELQMVQREQVVLMVPLPLCGLR